MQFSTFSRGLLAGHILSEYVRDRYGEMTWYKGELLNLALDIGYRLLPAFNSSTGLPHPRVNLRYGIKSGKIKHVGETCTSCAGTMILEFAALSRLSGEPIFEEKVHILISMLMDPIFMVSYCSGLESYGCALVGPESHV